MDNNKKWLIGVGIVLIIVAGTLLFRSIKLGKVDYVIPGVPYFGMHNHTGQNKAISGDSIPAVFSLLEYWNPGKNNYVKTSNSFGNGSGFMNGEAVVDFFNKSGYVAKSVHLENNELGKYLNDRTKTPLLVFLPITANQPKEDIYYPAIVIIGVKEAEKKIIAHDFFLGNNYEISFAEFDQRWGLRKSEERKNYIVVQPQDLKGSLAEIGARKIEAYPKRTTTMEKAHEMLKNYVVGYGLDTSNLNSQALSYFLMVEKDTNFEKYLPPYFKVYTYFFIANSYLKTKNTEQAVLYAQKAIDANHDLNKPFNDWPGFEYSGDLGEVSSPWIILGDVSLEAKNYQKAEEAYLRALKISPNKQDVVNRLKMVEVVLNKAK